MAAARNSTARKNESGKGRGNAGRSKTGSSSGRSASAKGTGRGKSTSKSAGKTSGAKTSHIINDDDEKALSPARVREIYLFVYLAVSVFMLCSNFGICGSVGNVISGFFFGLFGWAQYLLPFYLFFAAAFLLSNGPKKSLIRRLIWIAVFLMVISFIAQLIHGTENVTAKSLYMDGYTDHKGGGFLFGGILALFYAMIGKVGVIILTILLMIVAVIMITGISVIDVVKKLFTVSYREEEELDDDWEEPDEPDYETPAMRRKRSGRELQMDLTVLPEEAGSVDKSSGKRSRRAASKKEALPAPVPEEEMTELRPDPYNDTVEQLKENARLRVRANQSAQGRDVSGQEKDTSGQRNAAMVPVSEDRGLSIPNARSFQQTAAGMTAAGITGTSGYEDKGSSGAGMAGTGTSGASGMRSSEGPRDFFDLKPARESYYDEVGGDFDALYGQEESTQEPGRSTYETDTGSGIEIQNETEDETGFNAVHRTEDPGVNGSAVEDDAYIPAASEKTQAAVKPGGKVNHQDTVQATQEIAQQLQAKPEQPKRKPYRIPPVNLLNPVRRSGRKSDTDIRETAMKLKSTMESFGVNVTITDYSRGPAVTRYEMAPEQGVKVSKILSLQDDIKLNLAAADIRIEAPIPGKSAIGIEVPNAENEMVYFRELIDSDNFKTAKSKIAFAIGKDIGGQIVVGDIAKMPHLLIAGATGSGKSVCVNTIIMSILYKAKPEEVRFIMVDPKQVELTAYNGIPHMLIPVVTDSKKAAGALNWVVQEMERRYKLFANYNVRNLEGFNKKFAEEVEKNHLDPNELGPNPIDPQNPDFRFMPQIVVIVDELADLMMVAKAEVEESIVRLSQLARAAGIHLIIATQRPSVDVITGLIKANVPSRIAFSVSSGTDSRTILDMVGAEKLLGKGDMLYFPTGVPKPLRVQGAFVSDEEVVAVTDYIKKQCGDTEYDETVTQSIDAGISAGGASGGDSGDGEAERYDEYFEEAGRLIIEKDKASIGYLQRAFRIGFNRAARIMDQLAEAGVVGPEEGTKPRKVLMTMDQFEEFMSL